MGPNLRNIHLVHLGDFIWEFFFPSNSGILSPNVAPEDLMGNFKPLEEGVRFRNGPHGVQNGPHLVLSSCIDIGGFRVGGSERIRGQGDTDRPEMPGASTSLTSSQRGSRHQATKLQVRTTAARPGSALNHLPPRPTSTSFWLLFMISDSLQSKIFFLKPVAEFFS